jgi:hypothetical protein
MSRAGRTALIFLCIVLGSVAMAGRSGIGIQVSDFSPGDDETEALFDVDSGPIPELFFRMQFGSHGVHVGAGFENWGRTIGGVATDLDFLPIVGSYRYHIGADKPVSFFAGGGVGLLFYNAELITPTLDETEIALMTALEPIVGVEFLSNKKVRLELSTKYTIQLFSTSDFDEEFQDAGIEPLDVDMSGLHVSFGVSIMFGE